MVVCGVAVSTVYGACSFFSPPVMPQEGIRVSWALTPAEAEKEFCRDGQKLLVTITETRLGKAVCATVAPEPEEKIEK